MTIAEPPPTVQQSSTTPERYVWTFPGSPVRIHLSLDVVERLLVEATDETLPRYEVGGVLVGRSESPIDLEITDFRPIACSGGHEGEYVLPATEWEKVERVKAAVQAEAKGVSVVGFYRSQSREGLRLEKEDLALMQGQFSDPSNVFLLIRSVPKGSSTAGFFFWENGVIEPDLCFNEFPLDAERLRVEARERRLAELLSPSGEDAVSEDATSKETRSAAINRPRHGLRWLLIATAGAVLCGLGSGYLLWSKAVVSSQSAATPASPLLLRVHTQGEDLRITWNRNVPVLQDASVKGLLTILDGDFPPREIALGRDELRATGSIVYSPLSKNVQIRLEITGSSNEMRETVLAVKGPSLQLPNSSDLTVTVPVESREVPEAVNSEQQPEDGPAPKPLRKIFSMLGKQPATGESWRQITLEAPALVEANSSPVSVPTALMEIAKAPIVSASEMAPPATIPTSSEPREQQQAPPLAQASTTSTPVEKSTSAPEANAVPSTTTFVGPQPTRKVLPSYPLQTRASITRDGEVKVKVRIDATGRVRQAEVISTAFPLLAGDTAIAARLWQFEPAKLNGKNIESETVLVFNVRAQPGAQR